MASDNALWAYAKINWGSAQTEDRGPQAVELERLYVLDSAKGQGLGGQLMEWASEQARSMSAQELWLGVWEHNLAARSFYARYHFSEVGSHVFRLGSDDQTDLILSKPL
jgi:GNAT superfamily N-acetyltransferase